MRDSLHARHTADGATEVAMLLSVLIPVYNERKTLATLLEIVCAALCTASTRS